MIKYFLYATLLFGFLSQGFTQVIDAGIFHSERRSITFDFDKSDYQRDWLISPGTDLDVLRIYCENPVRVTFHFPSEEVEFTISERDTVDFSIVLKGRDTAHTRLIGVKRIPNSIRADEKLFHLSRLWSEVKYNFVNIDQIDFDWDSLYRAYIPLVRSTSNDYEYYKLLQRFYASLHDGHTQVFMPYDLSVYEDYIPISIHLFDNKLRITSIRKNLGLDSSFLAAEIISIDNIPIDIYLKDNILPYISASTEQSLWMQVPQAVSSSLREKPFRAGVLKTDGRSAEISIPHNGEGTRSDKAEYYDLRVRENKPWDFVQTEWLPDSILHLSINAFYPEEYVLKQLKEHENQIVSAKKLIIDLRKNGGGSTTVAHALQSHLTKDTFLLNYAWQTRINDGVRRANGNWIEEYADYYEGKAYRTEQGDTVSIPDTLQRWKMPMVILIGKFTFSAAEDFLVNLYETLDRPLLIGEESGGSTGSPLVIEDLPLDGVARLCTRRILYPYSLKPFVEKGVVPDITVEETFEDYCSGQDRTLQKALEVLSNLDK